ncbi:hypothetical protein Trydic_g4617 [Trypoxylus dichotomus]
MTSTIATMANWTTIIGSQSLLVCADLSNYLASSVGIYISEVTTVRSNALDDSKSSNGISTGSILCIVLLMAVLPVISLQAFLLTENLVAHK